MSLDVFGKGGGLTAFEEPSHDGERFRERDHVGGVVALAVLGPKEVTGNYGTSTVIVADVSLLSDGEIKEYPAAWLGASAIVDQLRGLAGRSGIVAKIATYENKRGQTGYKLVPPDAKEIAAIEAATSK